MSRTSKGSSRPWTGPHDPCTTSRWLTRITAEIPHFQSEGLGVAPLRISPMRRCSSGEDSVNRIPIPA